MFSNLLLLNFPEFHILDWKITQALTLLTPFLTVLVSLIQMSFLEAGTSTEDLPPSDCPTTCLWGIFLLNDWCVRAQPTVGGVTP